MRFDDAAPGRLLLRSGDAVLAEYIYEPSDAQLESPRPYALLRSRAGRDVTTYRPSDHVWHKGLSLALPNVGPHNFWGGPTYVDGDGYVQLPNNGAQVHREFMALEARVDDGIHQSARADERLDWVTEAGDVVLTEHRALTALELDDETWALTWSSRLTNVSGAPLSFGSPTSRGRPDAGYAGIFWRGPEEFSGGEISGPSGVVGDRARGSAFPWLAYLSPDRSTGIVMLDAGPEGSPWFARSADYAGLCPAPFFYDETVVKPGDALQLGAVLIVGGEDVASYAATVGSDLVADLRSDVERAHPGITVGTVNDPEGSL